MEYAENSKPGSPDPGNNCQPEYSRLQVSSIMALNTATDLYLMAIPLPMIYQSRLPLKKKISLLVIFSGGFLVMIFGILRCVSLLTVGATNPAESGEWSVRESFVAVLVSNLPMVFPLFQRWYRKALAQTIKDFSAERSYPLNAKVKNSNRFAHPLSIPNDTARGSDETIVVAANQGGGAKQPELDTSSENRDNKNGTRTKVQGTPHSTGWTMFGGRQGREDPPNGQITVVQGYTIQEGLTSQI
ncbi:hypothetical protein VTN77DRAFT_1084 [Rasamsonia byssochlamydoides]|uniref:uncharacterized protein n=1 Tax=Rasamsonia byssochlamydoides TaxID=89139 RepID=UPI0037435EE2